MASSLLKSMKVWPFRAATSMLHSSQGLPCDRGSLEFQLCVPYNTTTMIFTVVLIIDI